MIPNKSTFKFQELTPITGVKPYVIRFWETEFEDIAPITSDSGQKLYGRKDVEFILKIKKLLFEEKMSITEAKLALKSREVEITHLPSVPEYDSALDEGLDQSLVIKQLNASLELIHSIKVKRNW
jgi:DNA-binding transcriptional MerR regulator